MKDVCASHIYPSTAEFPFTISGEIVHNINHDNVYDGNSWWDLKSTHGELVSPGLYIYIVESEGLEHIGKFAIVR